MVIQQPLTAHTHLSVRSTRVKRGEVLGFRALREPFSVQPPTVRLATVRQQDAIITHGGREFVATVEMADCFLAKVHRVVDAGESALVPLLHTEGVDLLLICATTPLSVRSKDIS